MWAAAPPGPAPHATSVQGPGQSPFWREALWGSAARQGPERLSWPRAHTGHARRGLGPGHRGRSSRRGSGSHTVPHAAAARLLVGPCRQARAQGAAQPHSARPSQWPGGCCCHVREGDTERSRCCREFCYNALSRASNRRSRPRRVCPRLGVLLLSDGHRKTPQHSLGPRAV